MLALMRILADTPMSVGGLARSLSVSRPLIADLCTRLQAAGLAEREPDDADRRRVRVVLTEAGHLLCAETAASPETGSYEAVLAGLSPAERAQLRVTLREMDETGA
jgi:DNA-binding MarR family transcriptional regulator